VGPARDVVVRRRLLEKHDVPHVETEAFGHRPTAFRAHGRAASELIMRDDVVDDAADFAEAGGEHAARTSEAELHKVSVVNVQVQQRPTGKISVQEELLSPAGRLGDATKTRREAAAVSLLLDS